MVMYWWLRQVLIPIALLTFVNGTRVTAVEVGQSRGMEGSFKNAITSPCRIFLKMRNSRRGALPVLATGRFTVKSLLYTDGATAVRFPPGVKRAEPVIERAEMVLPDKLVRAMKGNRIPWGRYYPVVIKNDYWYGPMIQIAHRRFAARLGDKIIKNWKDIFHTEVRYLIYAKKGDGFRITLGRFDDQTRYLLLDYLPRANIKARFARGRTEVYALIAHANLRR